MIKLELDQKILNKNSETKIIEFYVQTIIGNNFSFVNTSNCAEKNYELYDVVMSVELQHINLFNDYLIKETSPKSEKSFIYNWNVYNLRWELDNRRMYDKKMEDLIGLEKYFDVINKEIQTYIKHKDTLIRLGESTGLNYILYGPPGTGKSSFVRALAMNLEIPIYVAKLTNARTENDITNMLIPKSKNTINYDDDDYENESNKNLTNLKKNDFKIVLLEDFDRYLKDSNDHESLSSIFNALDGIYPAYGIIRFFSANDPSIISNNKALLTRLNRSFFFDNPAREQIEKQIYNVFRDHEINKKYLNKFLDYIIEQDLSMRQITHILCQYLDSEDPLENLFREIEKHLDDLKNFASYKIDNLNSFKNRKKSAIKIDSYESDESESYDYESNIEEQPIVEEEVIGL